MTAKKFFILSILILTCCFPIASNAASDTPIIACIIPSYSTIKFWSDIENSIYEASQEQNVEMLMLYTKNTDSSLQISLDDALSIALYAEVDAIITSYTLANEGTDDLLASAMEKNIPVIMIDCDCPEQLRTAYIGIDNRSAGYQLAELALSNMSDGDSTLLLYASGSTSRENLQVRIEGIHNAFEDHNRTLTEVLINDYTVQSVMMIRQLLENDPSIKSILSISENSTLLCSQAITSSKRSDPICLYGFDESEDTRALLDEGRITALACQLHNKIGKSSIEVAVQLINGNTDAAGIHLIDFEIHQSE